MLLFLRRRIVRYVVAAIAIPLIGMLVLKAGNEMESRRGASMGSRSLRKIGAVMQNKGLGHQLRPESAR